MGFQKFEFGVQRPFKNRRGQDVSQADWGVIVSCAWRLVASDGSTISSDDYDDGVRRCPDEIDTFLNRMYDFSPVVETIEAQENGSVCLNLTEGYTLMIETDSLDVEPSDEQWRFLPVDRRRRHFVVTASGIE